MSATQDHLATVASVPSEIEAQLLVNLLGQSGIPARTMGGLTSQFRAEAPGSVRVVVRSEDLPAAQLALAEAQQHAAPARAEISPPPERSRFKQLALLAVWLSLIALVIAAIINIAVGGASR